MQEAWTMIERWEVLAPVTHRTPVPEVVVRAMCFVAFNLKWYSWVGITLLSFYGAGRLGEVLRCCREDLVLAADVFEELGSPIFLQLRKFKSLHRQPAKVQHMRIADPFACKVITMIFKKLPLDCNLFSASAYQYRKRWDIVIEILSLQNQKLTPGGLRAGAAVYHYKMGKPIADLLWIMRLRNLQTLESYLQETAALNTFAVLSPKQRGVVSAASRSFSFLLDANFDQG